ncbi:MAG: hypothetical protein SGI99_18555 [Pseudomonadota bacterium]|nr:hypothetical protein [Pseudomonadota bacterium]
MSTLLPAELAWYVTGRFYRKSDQSLADYGYFIHLAGIAAPMFNGAPGESTAHFTFAATPFVATGLVNGTLSLALDPVGEFSIYLQRKPKGNFNSPESFAQGECIATFRRISIAVGTTVAEGAGKQAQALFSSNVFTARLIDSAPFALAGATYDLRQMLGHGVTQFGTAAATPINPPPALYDLVIAFSGSAIALGG